MLRSLDRRASTKEALEATEEHLEAECGQEQAADASQDGGGGRLQSSQHATHVAVGKGIWELVMIDPNNELMRMDSETGRNAYASSLHLIG